MKEILLIPLRLIEMFVTAFPGPVGNKLRYLYWKTRLRHLGRGCVIAEGASFASPEHISIDDCCWIDRNVIIMAGRHQHDIRNIIRRDNPNFGDTPDGSVHIGYGVHIAPNCIISGSGGIRIGQYSGIAANTCLYSASHHYRHPDFEEQQIFSPFAPPDRQTIVYGPIVVADHAAVGAGCVILPGVSIGEWAWVAAGSTVLRDVPPKHLLRLDGSFKPIS